MTAIRKVRLAVPPSIAVSNECKIVRQCPLSAPRFALACHWRRDADGRLICVWQREPLSRACFDPEPHQDCPESALTEGSDGRAVA